MKEQRLWLRGRGGTAPRTSRRGRGAWEKGSAVSEASGRLGLGQVPSSGPLCRVHLLCQWVAEQRAENLESPDWASGAEKGAGRPQLLPLGHLSGLARGRNRTSCMGVEGVAESGME